MQLPLSNGLAKNMNYSYSKSHSIYEFLYQIGTEKHIHVGLYLNIKNKETNYCK